MPQKQYDDVFGELIISRHPGGRRLFHFSGYSAQSTLPTTQELFDFKVAMTIKIHEETRSVNEQFQTIHLLNDHSLQKYINNGYRYIHIGLVQVAVKPLVHMGVDAPIFMALRDEIEIEINN